jgi:SAM-dependent methyltransferase
MAEISKPDCGRDVACAWADAHKFSPAPRHRRRIIFGILKKIDYQSCLDAGCAQGYLIELLCRQKKDVCGCDISEKLIEANRKVFLQADFQALDISRAVYPLNRQFELVISSEVLEHIPDWQRALKNLTRMSSRYLLITVPCGKVQKIDSIVGHLRHFSYKMLSEEIRQNGFEVVLSRKWGFPVHSLYKFLINSFNHKYIYERYAAGTYGAKEKFISRLLYALFYINDIFPFGSQLFILAERRN